VNDLNEQYEKMRLEHEELKTMFEERGKALKELHKEYVPELKYAYAAVKEERKSWMEKYYEIYRIWYATLSKEEAKKEDERKYNEGACESEHRITRPYYEFEYERLIRKAEIAKQYVKAKEGANFIDEDTDEPPQVPKKIEKPYVRVIDDDSDDEQECPPPKPKPKSKPVKSVLSIIDGSDDESEEETTTINATGHKIMKALDVDFIE
jgi:hypothetical protein